MAFSLVLNRVQPRSKAGKGYKIMFGSPVKSDYEELHNFALILYI